MGPEESGCPADAGHQISYINIDCTNISTCAASVNTKFDENTPIREPFFSYGSCFRRTIAAISSCSMAPDKDPKTPKHEQIYRALEREIQTGQRKPGERLPSEAQLVGQF